MLAAMYRCALVMECHPRGTLLHALSSGQQGLLSWPQRLQLARQVALGLAHLHQQGIAHGDLKSANVLISADGKVRLRLLRRPLCLLACIHSHESPHCNCHTLDVLDGSTATACSRMDVAIPCVTS